VSKKFEKGSFLEKPKTALEILLPCEKELDGPVRPIHLALALKDYTAKKKAPRLIKSSNDMGRFVFVKE